MGMMLGDELPEGDVGDQGGHRDRSVPPQRHHSGIMVVDTATPTGDGFVDDTPI